MFRITQVPLILLLLMQSKSAVLPLLATSPPQVIDARLTPSDQGMKKADTSSKPESFESVPVTGEPSAPKTQWNATEWIKLLQKAVDPRLQQHTQGNQSHREHPEENSNTRSQLAGALPTVTPSPLEELKESHPDWSLDQWVEIWEKALKDESENNSPKSDSLPHETKSGSGKTSKDADTTVDSVRNTTAPTITAEKQLGRSHPDWGLDQWVEIWEKNLKRESDNNSPKSASLPHETTTSTDETSKDADKTVVPDQWVEIWGNALKNESQNNSPKRGSFFHEKATHGSETSKDAEATVDPVIDSAASTLSIDEQLRVSHPDWSLEQWFELWDKAVQGQDQSTNAHAAERTTSTTTRTLPQLVGGVFRDEYRNSAPRDNLKIPVPTRTLDDTPVDADTIHSAVHTTATSLSPNEEMRGKYQDWHVEELIEQWEQAMHDDPDLAVHTEEPMTADTKTSMHPEDLQHDQRPEVDQMTEQTHLQELDSGVSSTFETSTVSESENESPIPRGNIHHQTMELKEGTEVHSQKLNESKKRAQDDSLFGLDYTTALIIICCLSAVIAILIISLIVCVCCKKRTKDVSWKLKQLTTLNADANRIDLQILRPNKKSLDAFVFGRPIPTVEETLRTVVVPKDHPELRY